MELFFWLTLALQASAQDDEADRTPPASASAPAPGAAQDPPATDESDTPKPKKNKVKKKDASLLQGRQEDPQPQDESPVERIRRGAKLRADEYLWETKVGTQMEYNDNVIRLDKRDIDAFNDGSNPTKFRIRSVSDFIYTLSAEEDVMMRLFDEKTTVGVGFLAHFFQTNSFMDYQDYVAFLKTKLYEVKFTVEPHVYRREHRNLDTGLYESAFYSDYDAEFAVKIHPADYLQIRPKIDVQYRNFDAPFEFYSAVYLGFSPRATFEILPYLYTFGEYRLVWAQSFATALQPDNSYLENGIELGITVKPSKGLDVSLRYYFGQRDYTTSNDPFIDPNHAGRTDEREHLKLKAEWKIWPNLVVEGEYGYTQVLTNKPFRPDISEEEWSWQRNILMIGVTYQF